MDVEIIKKRMTLVNAHGPSNADKPDFFDTLSQQIEQMGNQFIIAGGDWNVLLNMNIDSHNYRGCINYPKARKNIMVMMEKCELIDVWREVYPEK